MEEVISSANLNRAFKRVKANGGSAGVDRMEVTELSAWIAANRDALLASLLDGSDQPQPVRGVQIPKPGGGVRQLGIPTVVDRLVQQAIAQTLEPLLDPTFSGSSFGFRPGRSAHDALRQAREYVADGYEIVVDLDLEKFPRVWLRQPVGMLRQGQPRHTHVPRGSPGDGQACAWPDPPVPEFGDHVERGDGRKQGGDAARRPALAASGQYPA